MVDSYGVIGNPVAHSLSPFIHACFAEQTSQALDYQPVFSAEDGFIATVVAFRQAGGRGLNVTLPFKPQAWDYADVTTPRADRAGAVNCLRFTDSGPVHGDSTDGAGLLRDLADKGLVVKGKRVLALGAGGAVRSVLGELLDERPAALTIANRTRARALRLLELFPQERQLLTVRDFHELERGHYELVINGTSAGLTGAFCPLPDGILAPAACCYDMAYRAAAQPFLDWARRSGARRAHDGLGMLVQQAAESFYLWRGIWPEVAPVLAAVARLQTL